MYPHAWHTGNSQMTAWKHGNSPRTAWKQPPFRAHGIVVCSIEVHILVQYSNIMIYNSNSVVMI